MPRAMLDLALGSKLKKPYYIGKYEVTQGQWSSVIKKNPSFFQNGKVMDQSDLHPVENVTWMMAQRFIKKLNRLEKIRPLQATHGI